MREILFRGKCTNDSKNKGKWVEGYPFRFTEKNDLLIMVKDGDGGCDKVIPESVGQYTGLIDRNGVKIFKGDIVSAYKNNDVPFTNVITFKKGCFWFGNWNWVEFLNMFRNVEVIGNIYDDV